MKTIGSIGEVLKLQSDFGMFILKACPWMADHWELERIGYVFVLDDNDINKVSTICTGSLKGRPKLLNFRRQIAWNV